MLTTPELPLSVSIISFNEAANIGRTLDSIKTIASEIIVVD
ncbi:MAG: glycosyltransferase family 2 protein, partial [Deltaproteobacteria bacterium]|nr:glycosyltransferase family 2 protein [Deltaproteobacteria bacterium]